MKREYGKRGLVLLMVSAALLSVGVARATTLAEKCQINKLKAAKGYCSCRLREETRALRRGDPPDYTRCDTRYDNRWQKAEDRFGGACPTLGDVETMRGHVTSCTDTIKECVSGGVCTPCPGSPCGNGVIDAPEQCDGLDFGGASCASLGFTGGGTLGCTAACQYDVGGCVCGTCSLCGNGVKEAGENCDGADLGGATCESIGLGPGPLACDPYCHFDFSGCSASCVCPEFVSTDSIVLDRSASQYLSASDSASLSIAGVLGDMTVEAWINIDTVPGNSTVFTIVDKGNSGWGNQEYVFTYKGDYDGKKYFHVETMDSSISQHLCQLEVPVSLRPGGLIPGTWYHVAFTFNTSTGIVQIYVSDNAGLGADGLPIGTCTSMGTSIRDGDAPFRVGSIDGAQHFFDGKIDDLRVWSTIRDNIIENKCCTPSAPDPDLEHLRGRWKFDGTYDDSSGNGNTLTDQNGTVFSSVVPVCP